MNLLAFILLMLAGGGLAWASERFNPKAPRWVALFVLLASGLWLLNLWVSVDGPLYAETKFAWIERFGISVYLSLDGLSLMLVALTLFLGIVAIASSWTEIRERTGFFQFNLVWTLAGVVGVFAASATVQGYVGRGFPAASSPPT